MKLTKEFIIREIADEYVLIPTGNTAKEFNGVVTLSETGQFIYSNIESVDSFEELFDKMKNRYDVEENVLLNDMIVFITELIQRGWIKPDDPEKGW